MPVTRQEISSRDDVCGSAIPEIILRFYCGETFFNFRGHNSATDTLFWTSGDVSFGF